MPVSELAHGFGGGDLIQATYRLQFGGITNAAPGNHRHPLLHELRRLLSEH